MLVPHVPCLAEAGAELNSNPFIPPGQLHGPPAEMVQYWEGLRGGKAHLTSPYLNLPTHSLVKQYRYLVDIPSTSTRLE